MAVRIAGSTPWPDAWPLLVDVNHFVRRISASDARLSVVIAVAAFIGVVASLARYWRRFDAATAERASTHLGGDDYVVPTREPVRDGLRFRVDRGGRFAHSHSSVAASHGSRVGTALLRHRRCSVSDGSDPAPVIAFVRVHVYTLAIAALALFQYRLLSRLSKAST
jgi:hypothetical protein